MYIGLYTYKSDSLHSNSVYIHPRNVTTTPSLIKGSYFLMGPFGVRVGRLCFLFDSLLLQLSKHTCLCRTRVLCSLAPVIYLYCG